MAKTAVIEISLIQESNEIPNEQLEKEILRCLEEYPPPIPWQKKAKKVNVKNI